MLYLSGNVNAQNFEVGIQSHSQQFSSDSIIVVFEWNVSNLQTYHLELLQNVSINVVPDLVAMYTGNKIFQLILLYSTLYIVNMLASVDSPSKLSSLNCQVCPQNSCRDN